jgi:hypothetical protein
MKIKPTLEAYLVAHSKDGTWTGREHEGVPMVVTQDGIVPAEPFLKHLGIKLTKTNKYTERVENAGMGESKSGGDTSDAGNGTSQSQE